MSDGKLNNTQALLNIHLKNLLADYIYQRKKDKCVWIQNNLHCLRCTIYFNFALNQTPLSLLGKLLNRTRNSRVRGYSRPIGAVNLSVIIDIKQSAKSGLVVSRTCLI